MKKIIGLFLLILSLLTVSACSETKPTDNKTSVDTQPTEVTEPENVAYTVKVLFPDGSIVTENASIQWCETECSLPKKVNSEGIASIELKDPTEKYYIHFTKIPTGYTYNPNIYTATKDSKHVEITLMTLSTPTSGDGSSSSRYVVSTGAYNVSVTDGGIVYYSFTANEAGTYVIESMAVDKLALNEIDPALGFKNANNKTEQITDGGVGANFKYEVTLEANATFEFMIAVSKATEYPAEFDFTISKK